MVGIIDRFEGGFVVVELENMEMINIEKNKIPQEAQVGDVINMGIKITINYNETEKRKKQIEELTNDLWK